MQYKRSSGLLLHPSSLPGRYGIGSFNQAAYDFVDFLEASGQSIWQVLPLGPTGYGDSPYQSLSTYAGNPYLIGLEPLVDDGMLEADELADIPEFKPGVTDYEQIYNWKLPLLKKMAARYLDRQLPDFEDFCQENAFWLDDYALYVVLKDKFQTCWNGWEWDLRSRQSDALARVRGEYRHSIWIQKFLQWIFSRQWGALKHYANAKGIKLFGDIPIFVSLDSSDAWCHPKFFMLDKELQPTHVAGVPPDFFSATGQLWGNPLYNWGALKADKYRWWIDRVRAAFTLFDLLRIDHFRGFAGFWEVGAQEATAENGKWVKGPGLALFRAIEAALGDLAIIAEDLGEITPDVLELRNTLGLPGMKIVQFAFSGPENPFLPHNYTSNFVVYTGTHDNNTVEGWLDDAPAGEKDFFRSYFGDSQESAADTMMRAAMSSVAVMAITPVQDLLGLGGEARMNYPGRAFDNWQWRLAPGQLGEEHAGKLKEWTRVYGRLPGAVEVKA